MKIESGKTYRTFLESEADSYVKVSIEGTYRLDFKLADCGRTINWGFHLATKKLRKKSVKKITKIKGVVDAIYEYIVEDEANRRFSKDDKDYFG
jgi:hypothetical protein